MKQTFQKTIILYNLLIIVCIASAISFYNYISYQNDILKHESLASSDRLSILSTTLDDTYSNIMNLLSNCATRRSVLTPSATSDSIKYTSDSISSAKTINVLWGTSLYSKYIYKILYYDNEFSVQAGSASGGYLDAASLMESTWFQENISSAPTLTGLTLIDNPFPSLYCDTEFLIPFLSQLSYTPGENPSDAWVFIGISPQLYTDTLSTLPDDSIAYAIAPNNEIIHSQNSTAYDISPLLSEINLSTLSKDSYRTTLESTECIVTYKRLPLSNVLLMEIIPISSIHTNYAVLMNTILIIFLFSIVIGLTLSILIAKKLNAPIQRLLYRLRQIATGNFEHDPTIESTDEIGIIGNQINIMSSQISDLIDASVENEHEKRMLEIKMLQAQINPHFLYNTLDSIKWIAIVQKNSGIAQVVTSLSSLLKNTAKGFNEKITIQQELDFLQHYITIEKVRYMDSFEVSIENNQPELLQAKIIKLTLQPIIENAIFSGIEPSGHYGEIKITITTDGETLFVNIIDNGVGIPSDKIPSLLEDSPPPTSHNMTSIGLPNVDRRCKLVYGDKYGLTIQSRLGEFTCITIAIPLEY